MYEEQVCTSFIKCPGGLSELSHRKFVDTLSHKLTVPDHDDKSDQTTHSSCEESTLPSSSPPLLAATPASTSAATSTAAAATPKVKQNGRVITQ